MICPKVMIVGTEQPNEGMTCAITCHLGKTVSHNDAV